MTNRQKLLVPLLMTGTFLFSATASANTRPIAEKQNITVEEDSSRLITLVAHDSDGDELTYKVVRKPRKGTLTKVSETEYTYTPKADFHGKDRFLFRVKDAKAYSRLAEVKIDVSEANDGVTAKDISLTTKENKKAIITLHGMGGDTIGTSYSIDTVPSNGTVEINNNKVIYQPSANFNGIDSFTYIYTDNVEGSSSPATVTIDVTPVNSRPTATNLTLKAIKDIVKTINLTGSDIEDQNFIFEIIRKPRKGTLSALSGNATEYTPKTGFIGKDSFSYRLVDSDGKRSRIARVKIDILDHIPTATDLTIEVTEDELKQVTLQGDDVVDDNATLIYEIVNQPSHGSLGNLVGATLDYTPQQSYIGTDSFSYRVINNDGGISTTATVQLNVIENQTTQLVGVQRNLDINTLKGWDVCHTQSWESTESVVSSVNSKCQKTNLMIACRVKGSNILRVAAHAPKADVMFDTGKSNTVHSANGVDWYFSGDYSWGFAKLGTGVQRNSCDTRADNEDYRMCWHTLPNYNPGYRCGEEKNNFNSNLEKVILQTN